MSSPNAALYIVCHDNYSKGYCSFHYGQIPYAKIHRIPTTQYFETHMFLCALDERREEWEKTDYVGMITWRAKQKLPLPNFDEAIFAAKEANADVIAFYKPTCEQQQDLIGWGEKCHPHFRFLWCHLCNQLGYNPSAYVDPSIPVFYCNYWMAKPAWMDKYMEHIKKAKHILETFDTEDGEFQRLLHCNSGFSVKVPRPGIPYVTYHCFLLERLPCLFFWTNGAKVHYC